VPQIPAARDRLIKKHLVDRQDQRAVIAAGEQLAEDCREVLEPAADVGLIGELAVFRQLPQIAQSSLAVGHQIAGDEALNPQAMRHHAEHVARTWRGAGVVVRDLTTDHGTAVHRHLVDHVLHDHAADVVEEDVDAVRRQGLESLGNVLVLVVDRLDLGCGSEPLAFRRTAGVAFRYSARAPVARDARHVRCASSDELETKKMWPQAAACRRRNCCRFAPRRHRHVSLQRQLVKAYTMAVWRGSRYSGDKPRASN